jgi:hypothetical protein
VIDQMLADALPIEAHCAGLERLALAPVERLEIVDQGGQALGQGAVAVEQADAQPVLERHAMRMSSIGRRLKT